MKVDVFEEFIDQWPKFECHIGVQPSLRVEFSGNRIVCGSQPNRIGGTESLKPPSVCWLNQPLTNQSWGNPQPNCRGVCRETQRRGIQHRIRRSESDHCQPCSLRWELSVITGLMQCLSCLTY